MDPDLPEADDTQQMNESQPLPSMLLPSAPLGERRREHRSERSRGERFFDKHFISKAIYGTISVLAVLLIMEEHPPTAWHGAMTLFGSVLAIALAEAYSETIAEILAGRKGLTRKEMVHIWVQTRPILLSANTPTLMFCLSGLGLLHVESAILIAKVLLYVSLFIYGSRISRMLGNSWLRSLLSGLFTLGIGVLITLIKTFFH